MSVGFHNWRFLSISTPNINEASRKDFTASLHRNVVAWGGRCGQEEKESVSTGAIACSAYSQVTNPGSFSEVSHPNRTASLPDVMGRSAETAFCSITITDWNVLASHSTSWDTINPVSPPPKLQDSFVGRGLFIPRSATRPSNAKLGLSRQNPAIVVPCGFRQASAPADELAMRDRGRNKERLGRCRLSCREPDRKQDTACGSFTDPSPRLSYQACIHLEIPLWSVSTFVFLDKLLSISLVELESRRFAQTTLHRSTLFVHLSGSAYHRCSTELKTNEADRKPGAAMFVHNNNHGHENGGDSSRPPLKHQGGEVELICGINSKADDSGTKHHRDTLESLTFREPSLSFKKAGRQKGNTNEPAFQSRNNPRHRKPTSSSGPEDSRTLNKPAGSDATEERQELDRTAEPRNIPASQKSFSGTMTYCLEGTSDVLSLKEALEHFRPGFIRRSQGRMRRLEQRAMKRRALRNSHPDLGQGQRDNQQKKRNCTTPDPLSDNLFKPRERFISGKEMQQRSRRLYNKLPEVLRKKEEEKKKAVIQINRLRAQVFKKSLLDQILQR